MRAWVTVVNNIRPNRLLCVVGKIYGRPCPAEINVSYARNQRKHATAAVTVYVMRVCKNIDRLRKTCEFVL